MNRKSFWGQISVFTLVSFFSSFGHAQFINQSYPVKGDLLTHAAPVMGRLAIIETLGDYVITIPERPSSPQGSDVIVRAWDISTPTNPVEVGRFGTTTHPFAAHGMIKRGNQILLNPYTTRSGNAIQLNSDGTLSLGDWQGIDGSPNKDGMMRPWGATNYWSYGAIGGNTTLTLDGNTMASWDHLGQTGVIGMPIFMGNIMIYASDQSMTGVAAYDISDPRNPRLLDVLTLPSTHPTLSLPGQSGGAPYGLGGYWAEVSGNYLVFARRGNNPGVQVVDISDPSNLRYHCDYFPMIRQNIRDATLRPGPMYVGFQDEYVFAGQLKVNLNDCSLDNYLIERGTNSAGMSYTVDTDQYSRPIGNLLLSGGQGGHWSWPAGSNGAGLGIWVHDTNRDTSAPYVAYHIPRANQTSYPTIAPISLSIPETIRTEEIVIGQHLRVDEVSGSNLIPVPIDYVFSHTGMMTVNPSNDLRANTTYQVTLSGIRDAVGNSMQTYSYRFSTGSSVAGGSAPAPTPTPTPTPTPAPSNAAPTVDNVFRPTGDITVGTTISVDVMASDVDGDALEYRFRLGSGSYTNWSASNQFNGALNIVGINRLDIEVRDGNGGVDTQTENFSVIDAVVTPTPTPTPQPTPDPTPTPVPSGPAPMNSTQVVFDAVNNAIWAVNSDNDSVTKIDATTLAVIAEYPVGDDPRGLVVDQGNNIWITLHGSDQVQVINGVTGQVQGTLDTGYGSAPYGIVMHPTREEAYVSLYGSGEVIHISTDTGAILDRLNLGYSVRALALSDDASTLLATRFISEGNWGEVWQINTSNLSLTRTIPLYKRTVGDDVDNGNGIPNYLSSVIINSAGTHAYIVGKKDNVDRGLLNNSLDIDDDNTVRTFAAVIDLTSGQELTDRQFDFDNADSPSALAMTPDGSNLFVGMQGRNEVFVLDSSTENLSIRAQFSTGLAPQGLFLNTTNNQLYSKNFTDRSVSVIDVANFLANGGINPATTQITTVANETLSSNELAGKQIFYNAAFGRSNITFTGKMSAESYISCATCHIDGGHDGRSYDFTGRGEGLRNNISLKGRGGVRFGDVHWTGNFDEIQDFENDIRANFKGSGLMTDADFAATQDTMGVAKAGLSQELDDLAAYVSSLNKSSLPKSPFRSAVGGLTAEAQRGQQVFQQEGCDSCHRGNAFTDGALHDVGSGRSYSGQRLGSALSGFKTPSLLSVFDSAPYLHDGSAKTIDEVFMAAGGVIYQAEDENHNGLSLANTNYPSFRSGNAVALTDGASVNLVHPTTSGAGTVAFRYGSSSNGATMTVSVGGHSTNVNLDFLPQVNSEDVNFTEAKVLVNFPAGNADIRLTFNGVNANDTVMVDDISIADPAAFSSANVHTRVTSLTQTQQDELKAFLLQIDRSNAPEDTEVVQLGSTFVEPGQNDQPVNDPVDSQPDSGSDSGEEVNESPAEPETDTEEVTDDSELDTDQVPVDDEDSSEDIKDESSTDPEVEMSDVSDGELSVDSEVEAGQVSVGDEGNPGEPIDEPFTESQNNVQESTGESVEESETNSGGLIGELLSGLEVIMEGGDDDTPEDEQGENAIEEGDMDNASVTADNAEQDENTSEEEEAAAGSSGAIFMIVMLFIVIREKLFAKNTKP